MHVFIVSLVSCLVLTFLLRGAAHHFGIVDHPGGRKQHTHPTPMVGGLAMFVAVLLAFLVRNGLTGDIKVLMGCSAAIAYDPNTDTNATGNLIGPHGRLVGFGAQQSFKWNAWTITPELGYTHLAEGQSIGVNKTNDIRGGVTFSRPLGAE